MIAAEVEVDEDRNVEEQPVKELLTTLQKGNTRKVCSFGESAYEQFVWVRAVPSRNRSFLILSNLGKKAKYVQQPILDAKYDNRDEEHTFDQ